MDESHRQLSHDDYTVGWICALPKTELVAAAAMLDEEHPILPADPQDTNTYLLGRIGHHNVVIACLPAETTGKVSAATVAKDMIRTFKAVRFGLMVGIGGGAPYYGVEKSDDGRDDESEDENEDSEEEYSDDTRDIRLGDVVISLHSKSREAVVQYDFGKSEQEKEFVRAGGKLNKPPNIVLNAVSMLQAQHERKGHNISELLSEMLTENPRMATKFGYPGSAKDRLFKSSIIHKEGEKSCKACGPSDVNLVKRKNRHDGSPKLHYGTIGSADQVMKDALLRDKWAQKEKIMCFEMEAAGLMDSFPCLVIRGICDYADSHKNKIWQPYAAATAAAYAKELLLVIPGQGLVDLPPIEQIGNKIIRQLGAWRRSNDEEKCLQAFRTTEYERQKNLNPEREAETCLWCLDDERFRNWRDKSTSCLLWVTADPGCGKSVLSRALVDERLLDSAPNDTTICYFFFKDTSEDQRSPANALAALLHQLFTSHVGQKAIKYALPRFRENANNISQNLQVMWRIVQDIALDSDFGKIIFLIDALDECQRSEQENLIRMLMQLERTSTRHGSKETFKFFITSRPYWDIEREFHILISNIPSIRLRGETQSATLRSEIDRVIRCRVSKLDSKIVSSKAREKLLEELLKVENRTYLWLHLIFNLIASEPRVDTVMVQSLVQELPTTVEEAYEAILRKSNNKRLSKRLLQIIVAAVRPLSVNEIGVALCITEATRTYEDLELQEEEQFEVTIRHLCGLFVSIVEKKVLLIHQTAKEFLITQNDVSPPTPERGIWKNSLSVRESNLLLAEICMHFMQMDEFGRKFSSQSIEVIKELISKYNFFDYSAENWAIHFRAAVNPNDDRMIALGSKLCDVQNDRYLAWVLAYWRKDDPWSTPVGFTSLHLASFLGLEVVVDLLLAAPGIDVNAADEVGRTPLSHAASGGYEVVVDRLLAAPGIDVNAADVVGMTPLSRAASRGYKAVVDRLLAAPGIDVNAADEVGRTPLSRAAYEGYEAIVDRLLAAPGIGVNAASKDGTTPLWWAAYGGYEAVVDRLLAAPGIDVNAADEAGKTPLQHAAFGGHEAVVDRLLAAPGIDVNMDDKDVITRLKSR